MKLTKDEDSFNIEIRNEAGERVKVYTFKLFEVLKWKKDAEKMERIDSLFTELQIPIPYDLWLANSLKDRKIVERLKKRIEELTPLNKQLEYHNPLEELQKILGGMV